MRRGRYVLALLVLLATVAVGCRAAGEPYNTPNPLPVCTAAAALEARLADLRNLDVTTATRDEVVTAVTDARNAWITLQQQSSILAEDEAVDLAVQLNNLRTAASQLPEGTTPAQASDLLSEELAAVDAAWRSLQGDLGCPDLSASPAPA